MQRGLEELELAQRVFVSVELEAVRSDVKGYDSRLEMTGETCKLVTPVRQQGDSYEVKVAIGVTEVRLSSDTGAVGIAW